MGGLSQNADTDDALEGGGGGLSDVILSACFPGALIIIGLNESML